MIVKIILIFSLIFTFNIIVIRGWRNKQAVIVSGQLLCQGSEGSHVSILLYGKPRLGRHHLLARTYSDINGYFESNGHRTVWFGIHFYLKLIHYCLETNLLCRYEAILKIPSSFIFKYLNRRQSFGLGAIELSAIPNQKRICVHPPSRRRRRS
uniref:Transthyretin-like family protein n=1 Tax=Strongyloides venezuelensis TaxID=75913 RepID=A0A0K0FAE5_STRVS